MIRTLTALFLILILSVGLAGCNEAPPIAQFYAADTNGEVPVKVQFNDLSVGDVTSWQWDFDSDGVVDSKHPNPSYLFNYPGNYTVSLTVSGPGGNNTEVKKDYLAFTAPPCTVDFAAGSLEVTGRVPIQFTDKSTGNITGWAWDFNSDGKIESNEQNPTYMYYRNGSYSVTLTVKGPGCIDGISLTRYHYIQVSGCGG